MSDDTTATATAGTAAADTDKPKKKRRAGGRVQDLDGVMRSDMFMVPLSMIKMVTDPRHYLYKPTCTKPLPEERVDSIRNGFLRQFPVLLTKDGTDLLLVDGRTRYRCLVEKINPEREKAGMEPLMDGKVPAVMVSGNELVTMGIMAQAHNRQVEPAWSVAISCGHCLAQMGDEPNKHETVAAIFGVSRSQVRNYERYFTLSRKLQKAVEAGALTMSDAIRTWEAPKVEQDEIAEKAVEAQRAGRPKRKKTKPGVKKISDMAEKLKSGKARVALLWALGRASLADLKAEFPELV